jgi:hypothetical protein
MPVIGILLARKWAIIVDVKIGLIKGPIKKLYRLGGLINDGFSPIISSG